MRFLKEIENNFENFNAIGVWLLEGRFLQNKILAYIGEFWERFKWSLMKSLNFEN
jgi:hypothetical protein